MTEEKLTERHVTYLGRRISKGGKIAYAAALDGDEKWYTKRPFGLPSYATPGQTFVVTFGENGSFYVAGEHAPRFEKLFPDAEIRAQWAAADRAADAEAQAARETKKGGDSISELCAPLRRVYQRSSPFERAALLVRIIAEVQAK